MRIKGLLAAAAASSFLALVSAQASQVMVTVQNVSNTGGLSLSPLFVGFHNGTYDIFNAGGTASSSLESLAELGNAGGLMSDLSSTDPTATMGLIAAPANGLAQIEPGETAAMVFNVNGTLNKYFSFGAMVVPSNDAFTANDDPMGFKLFGAAGNFLGTKTIWLTGNDVWDAGTEVNGLFGSAFIVGQDATQHIAENGTIMLHPGFGIFDGQMMANGNTLNVADADVSARGNFDLARITISAVPEPASLPLLFAEFGIAFWFVRRRSGAAPA